MIHLWLWQRVRLVDMNGCMAHRRENERYGRVVGFERRHPYGSSQPVNYVKIRMDDGTYQTFPNIPNLWSRLHDGTPEYQL